MVIVVHYTTNYKNAELAPPYCTSVIAAKSRPSYMPRCLLRIPILGGLSALKKIEVRSGHGIANGAHTGTLVVETLYQ